MLSCGWCNRLQNYSSIKVETKIWVINHLKSRQVREVSVFLQSGGALHLSLSLSEVTPLSKSITTKYCTILCCTRMPYTVLHIHVEEVRKK